MPIPWTQPLPEAVAPLLAGYPIVVQQPIAWGDMDANQHVNNVLYFRYMESSRIEYMARLRWDELRKETGVWGILADAHLRFRKPVLFPDTLFVGARVLWMGEDRFTLEHRMVSVQRGEVTTEGQGTIVAFDYNHQRKTALPAVVIERLEAIEGRKLSATGIPEPRP